MSISNRITLLNKHIDVIVYLAKCACSSDNHDLMIFLEKDEDELKLEFYIDVIVNKYFGLWGEKNIFLRLKNSIYVMFKRIKISLRVLFKGRIELNQEFLLDNTKQVNDFIKALEEGKEYLKD